MEMIIKSLDTLYILDTFVVIIVNELVDEELLILSKGLSIWEEKIPPSQFCREQQKTFGYK